MPIELIGQQVSECVQQSRVLGVILDEVFEGGHGHHERRDPGVNPEPGNQFRAAAIGQLDLASVLEIVYRKVSSLMDTSTFYIGLYDAETEQLRITGAYEPATGAAQFLMGRLS